LSYDLNFFKVPPGISAVECYETIPWENPEAIDPSLRIDIRRLADDLVGLGLGLEEVAKNFAELARATGLTEEEAREQFSGIEINTKELGDAPLQLQLDTVCVCITMPYWEFSPDSQAELQRYWSGILPVLKAHGLVGYDPQRDVEIRNGGLEEIFSSLQDVRTQTVGAIGAAQEPKKPWWKVW
jgi:hypothetical protein